MCEGFKENNQEEKNQLQFKIDVDLHMFCIKTRNTNKMHCDFNGILCKYALIFQAFKILALRL